MDKPVRVRFAPSPTGPLHIGGARSALFNWLIARQTGGKLILRIEDTDLERSSRESEENIKDALLWLGITWDEGIDVGGEYGPYRQTERLDIYRRYTEMLLEKGLAYHCYCSEGELEAERQQQMDKGETPRYLGKCRHLTPAEKERYCAEGRNPVVRFRVPEGENIILQDLVRGQVVFESDGIGDFVIVKSDGIPVYNYAVVIDDTTMDITHVIRGEEHLSNTPRQLLIYNALGLTPPRFAHISLILGKDRTKMSKRHGSTAVEQYKNKGYLPAGLLNFLALLGWSPAGEQEFFSLEDLIHEFSLERVAKNPAVFDSDKLNFINSHYLKRLTLSELTDLTMPHLVRGGYITEQEAIERRTWLEAIVDTVKDYLSYAAEITDHVEVFFNDSPEFENEEVREILRAPETAQVMAVFKEKLAAVEELSSAVVQSILKSITKELKLGGKKVYMPVRIALTGKAHGPELDSLIAILGQGRTASRIDAMMAKI
jgi:nondiscriminating glutamyl-tRNA synthetase